MNEELKTTKNYCALPIFNTVVESKSLILLKVLDSVGCEEESAELLKLALSSFVDSAEEKGLDLKLETIKCQACPLACADLEEIKEKTFYLITDIDYLNAAMKMMEEKELHSDGKRLD